MTASRTRVLAHARWELGIVLRNGEQLLLTLVIPIALLIGLNTTTGVQQAMPVVLATSILATCFTSLAIGTGFERRSGALAFLATTPLTRLDLLLGKLLATAGLALVSALVTIGVGLGLGWRPSASWLGVAAVLLAGGAASAAWAVLLAGTVRAEAVLAIANGLFILLVAFGGIVFPTSSMPETIGTLVAWLPSAALGNGLRVALTDTAFPSTDIIYLLAWAVIGASLARRHFRWD